ncbi:hypothetical protein [Alkalicoccobacillus murimartini]|uniref:hypothetical protein n=1 Tax=Alkalicoccobacillus murimartini TaxID=171685 RepID=UPI0027D79134|nr:hypothetical protein [Alkalicoccobacillus murimartini]
MSSAKRETRSESQEVQETSSLPPRGEIQQRRRQRREKAPAFPLAKILLVLFLLLVGIAVFIAPRLF